jgi:acetyl-CoA C-acetyltransferase
MTPPYTPILAGVAQYTQPKDIERPLDPMGLMVRTCRAAFDDAGSGRLRDLIDEVYVVNLFQWPYRDAPGMLAEALGIRPRGRYYTPIGGNTPQMLVNRACRALASGTVRAVLITGAEAIYSLRRALGGKIVINWPESGPPERIDGEERTSVNRIEADYDLFFPAAMYPLFETALRASSGRSVEEHREYVGRLWERFSRLAAANPHAWIRRGLSAREIIEVTPDNRYINYPYTKYMNANINVDQSAAVIVTTAETAQMLGTDPAGWVYPLGGADFSDIWHVSRRPRLDSSPAIQNASRLALTQAGLDSSDIDFFDLYSCFPSAVQIAMKEIGIAEDDPRDLTLTGGLAFFGGPGNNYSLHGIASAAERIRAGRSKKAMVTANGWYITKHSIGIYSGDSPERPWEERDDSPVQEAIDAEALPEPVEKAEGDMMVEAYVIRHDRQGKPALGTVIGRLPDGGRTLAHIDAGTEELEEMERVELVGRTGQVRHIPGKAGNRIRL